MEARISPSSVKPEEFGFIKGRVSYVSDFPDTPAALMRNFENEVLVRALTNGGPVTELHVEMAKNSNGCKKHPRKIAISIANEDLSRIPAKSSHISYQLDIRFQL